MLLKLVHRHPTHTAAPGKAAAPAPPLPPWLVTVEIGEGGGGASTLALLLAPLLGAVGVEFGLALCSELLVLSARCAVERGGAED
jgi:hypothetical protein